jgi:hypothetical protein
MGSRAHSVRECVCLCFVCVSLCVCTCVLIQTSTNQCICTTIAIFLKADGPTISQGFAQNQGQCLHYVHLRYVCMYACIFVKTCTHHTSNHTYILDASHRAHKYSSLRINFEQTYTHTRIYINTALDQPPQIPWPEMRASAWLQ